MPTPPGAAIPIDDDLSSVANNTLSSLGVSSGGFINIAADNRLSSDWESDGRIELTLGSTTWLFKPDTARWRNGYSLQFDDTTQSRNFYSSVSRGGELAVVLDDGAVPTVRLERLIAYYGGIGDGFHYRTGTVNPDDSIQWSRWVTSTSVNGIQRSLPSNQVIQFRNGADGTPFPETPHRLTGSDSIVYEGETVAEIGLAPAPAGTLASRLQTVIIHREVPEGIPLVIGPYAATLGGTLTVAPEFDPGAIDLDVTPVGAVTGALTVAPSFKDVNQELPVTMAGGVTGVIPDPLTLHPALRPALGASLSSALTIIPKLAREPDHAQTAALPREWHIVSGWPNRPYSIQWRPIGVTGVLVDPELRFNEAFGLFVGTILLSRPAVSDPDTQASVSVRLVGEIAGAGRFDDKFESEGGIVLGAMTPASPARAARATALQGFGVYSTLSVVANDTGAAANGITVTWGSGAPALTWTPATRTLALTFQVIITNAALQALIDALPSDLPFTVTLVERDQPNAIITQAGSDTLTGGRDGSPAVSSSINLLMPDATVERQSDGQVTLYSWEGEEVTDFIGGGVNWAVPTGVAGTIRLEDALAVSAIDLDVTPVGAVTGALTVAPSFKDVNQEIEPAGAATLEGRMRVRRPTLDRAAAGHVINPSLSGTLFGALPIAVSVMRGPRNRTIEPSYAAPLVGALPIDLRRRDIDQPLEFTMAGTLVGDIPTALERVEPVGLILQSLNAAVSGAMPVAIQLTRRIVPPLNTQRINLLPEWSRRTQTSPLDIEVSWTPPALQAPLIVEGLLPLSDDTPPQRIPRYLTAVVMSFNAVTRDAYIEFHLERLASGGRTGRGDDLSDKFERAGAWTLTAPTEGDQTRTITLVGTGAADNLEPYRYSESGEDTDAFDPATIYGFANNAFGYMLTLGAGQIAGTLFISGQLGALIDTEPAGAVSGAMVIPPFILTKRINVTMGSELAGDMSDFGDRLEVNEIEELFVTPIGPLEGELTGAMANRMGQRFRPVRRESTRLPAFFSPADTAAVTIGGAMATAIEIIPPIPIEGIEMGGGVMGNFVTEIFHTEIPENIFIDVAPDSTVTGALTVIRPTHTEVPEEIPLAIGPYTAPVSGGVYIPLLNPRGDSTITGEVLPISFSYSLNLQQRGLDFTAGVEGAVFVPFLNPLMGAVVSARFVLPTPGHIEVPETISLPIGPYAAEMDGAVFIPLLNPSMSAGLRALFILDPPDYKNVNQEIFAGPYVASVVGNMNADLFVPASGVTFRTAPDRVETRGRPVAFNIPKVVNEPDGGAYAVRGLPPGLRQEGERVVGSTRAITGEYTVTVDFVHPAVNVPVPPVPGSATAQLNIATPIVTRANP